MMRELSGEAKYTMTRLGIEATIYHIDAVLRRSWNHCWQLSYTLHKLCPLTQNTKNSSTSNS